jgi:putative acetyltransferase
LTAKGRARLAAVHHTASARLKDALDVLTAGDRRRVREGLALYAGALARSRRRAALTLRPVTHADNRRVAAIIRTVMAEFGAVGPGYAINDAEVDNIFGAYPRPRARYLVVTDGLRVLGGGGYGPLAGGSRDTCELRRMYFLNEARGLGLGDLLISRLIESARKDGYRRMYLETLKSMSDAARLYDRKGFLRAPGALGATGHFGCDAWYARDL